jgi:uncharacterized lipoprotein YmbA
MKSHTLIAITALALTGCATATPVASYNNTGPSPHTYSVRDAAGVSQYRIRDGAVLTPSGVRVARIDSRGNIYSTQGATAGQRIGRVK